jgi:hypothetical protein
MYRNKPACLLKYGIVGNLPTIPYRRNRMAHGMMLVMPLNTEAFYFLKPWLYACWACKSGSGKHG